MNRNFALLATAAALALSGLSAHAACVDPRVAVQTAANQMPPVLPAAARAAGKAAANDDHHGDDDIVGTWIVNYSSGGNSAGTAFIQWHDDGTEWENIDFPILGGSVCMGEWRRNGHRQYSRQHIGWLYTDGNLSGYFTETETDTLSHDGDSYTGTNDQKIFDLQGNLQVELTGASSATRFP
jgi:hypothetical protein